MPQPCVKKARTALAEEAGRIATLTEKQIMNVDSDYILSRIPETTYQWGMGENPRGVRYQVTPPLRTDYQPILNTGNRAITVPDPNPGREGQTISTFGDTHGRGCNIPAETLHFGYDEFGRCLRATAMETDPVCIIDLLQKHSWSAFIRSVREAMPRFGKEFFVQELLRQVARLSYRKYSIAPGLPVSVNSPDFPAVPTGGLSIAALQRIADPLRVHGWDDGAKSTTVDGKPAIQVYAGRNAIEFAIIKHKQDLGLELRSTLWENDGRGAGGVKTIYGDIEFVVNPMPVKGYLKPHGSGFRFIEIPRRKVIAAGKEGLVATDNPDYDSVMVNDGGVDYRVIELFHIIHPRAMERQAAGSIPDGVDGMNVPKNFFNFEVNFLNDTRVASPDCNKDYLWFQYRMVHAYAPYSENPELMTAGVFLSAQPQFVPHDPYVLQTAAILAPVSIAPLPAPRAAACTECDDETFVAREPVPPTCETLYPANGVGVVQFATSAYPVHESIAGVTLAVERVGGTSGAAGVHYATAAGTAIAGTNYTTTAGDLAWADGEGGIKTFVVPILQHAGSDDGKAFTAVLSSATGAALGTPTTATVTIIDP